MGKSKGNSKKTRAGPIPASHAVVVSGSRRAPAKRASSSSRRSGLPPPQPEVYATADLGPRLNESAIDAVRSHNSSLEARAGTVLALDFEGLGLHGPETFTELGIATLRWTSQSDGTLSPSIKFEHFICSDFASLKVIPNDIVAKREILKLADVRARFVEMLSTILATSRAILLVHGGIGDIKLVLDALLIPSSVLKPMSWQGRSQPRLEVGSLVIHDSQLIFDAIEKTGLKKLATVCQALGVKTAAEGFHNGANDAWYTLLCWLRLQARLNPSAHARHINS